MKTKVQERERALELRKLGYSYKDILKEISVSKSTISSWLKDLPTTAEEKRYLKDRVDANISRGRIKSATANRRNRLERDQIIFEEAKKQFDQYKNNPLFYIGISLYWAEGAKRSSIFQFMNSDSDMVNTMIRWCSTFFNKDIKEMYLRVYMHKVYGYENCEKQWSKDTGIPLDRFKKTIYKPSGLGVKKRPMYKGCVRLEIKNGTVLFKKMQFWQNLLISELKKGIV